MNSDNTDPLSISRYNLTSDVSDLRVTIGDNASISNADYFSVGSSGSAYDLFAVRSDGNVGIGVRDAVSKFEVRGKSTFSRDGAAECCGNDATIAIAETIASGRRASISFHNSGESEGYIQLVQNSVPFLNVSSRRIQMNDLQGAGMGLELTGGLFYGNAYSRTQTRDNAGLMGDAGAQSGFYETSNPVNFYNGASSWQHFIDVRHSNQTNNYAMQLAGSFFDQKLFVRKTNTNAAQAWREVVTVPDNSAGYSAEHCMDQGAATTNLTALTGVDVNNGFCFLTYVRGKFEGGGEVVHVTQSGTDWVIAISSGQSAVRGCARCFRTRQ